MSRSEECRCGLLVEDPLACLMINYTLKQYRSASYKIHLRFNQKLTLILISTFSD